MWLYTMRRLLAGIPVLFGVTVLTFLMVHIAPGNPIDVLVPDYATPAVVAALKAKYGLDKPLWDQYWIYLWHALHGDLGRSIRTGLPVSQEIMSRFPATVELAVVALLVALILGIPTGIVAAVRRNSILDYFTMGVSVLWVAMPSFYLALLLQIYFAKDLGWFPVAGRTGPAFTWPWLLSITLPAVSLGARSSAILARLTRSTFLEQLQADYVRTARAKGVTERRMHYRHVLKNALIPIATVVGLEIGGLITGVFITETIFAWPGVGRLGVAAIFNRDLPVVQGTVLLTGVAFVLVNLAVDLLYAAIDPRVRYE